MRWQWVVAFQAVGQSERLFGHALYQRPALDGRLHWASTETATDHDGQIEGTIGAGERAARAVPAAIGVPNNRSTTATTSR